MNSVLNHSWHWTRPINEHDHCMVLAFWKIGDLLKKILTVLVSVNLVHVKSSLLWTIRSAMNVRSFLHFKLFDHVTNHLLIVFTKLIVKFVLVLSSTIKFSVKLRDFLWDGFIINNQIFVMNFRKSHIRRSVIPITHLSDWLFISAKVLISSWSRNKLILGEWVSFSTFRSEWHFFTWWFRRLFFRLIRWLFFRTIRRFSFLFTRTVWLSRIGLFTRIFTFFTWRRTIWFHFLIWIHHLYWWFASHWHIIVTLIWRIFSSSKVEVSITVIGFRFVFLTVCKESVCDFDNIIKGFSSHDFINPLSLFFSKINSVTSTRFGVKVDSVNQIQFVDINTHFTNTKEVSVHEFIVTITHRFSCARKLSFDFLLNTCIFYNIEKWLVTTSLVTCRGMPTLFRSPECMTYFVRTEKVINIRTRLPF